MSRQEEGFGDEKAAVATCCVVGIVTARVNAKVIENEYLVLEEKEKEAKKSKEQEKKILRSLQGCTSLSCPSCP